jgi:UTP--glucose-1-phosphate uridylyltransferase
MYVSKEKPAIKQMMDVFDETQSSILGTMEVKYEDTYKYGICTPKYEKKGRLVELKDVVEKPDIEVAPSRSAIGGRYVLTPTIFKYLKNQQKGKGNEIQLTDAILRLMKEEKVFAYDIEAKRYDVGNKLDYIEAILDTGLATTELKEGLKALIKEKAKIK